MAMHPGGPHSNRLRALTLTSGWVTALCLSTHPAHATWSIIIVDTATSEIAVGSATCLIEFDLQAELPVVIVDLGAACAQALIDWGATNRMQIHGALLTGTPPDDIIAQLQDSDTSHEQRQYGIVTVEGRATTFTGHETLDFADGIVGESGALVYAIQGNVLTGGPVIDEAEQAILTTSGDLPEKLMAAMEAASLMGGDGRCSCYLPEHPTLCGSPPVTFDKAAHIGFMIVARTGDAGGVCDPVNGCANGDYYLNFNVADQLATDPDPVLQLRALFDAWRADLVGRPDAVQSTASVSPSSFPADGTGSATLTVTPRDWQETFVAEDGLVVTVVHAPDSDHVTTIGPVVADGGGVYHVELTGTHRTGRDHFLVTADDGGRPAVVIPRPSLLSIALTDLDRDGDVDRNDLGSFSLCVTGPSGPVPPECTGSDGNRDGSVDLRDFGRFQREYTDSACVELRVHESPESTYVFCGAPFTLRVTVTADPPASFQWFFDGEPIPGATGPEYSVAAAGNTHLGQYHVRVTNTCASLTTDPVKVNTYRPPCP